MFLVVACGLFISLPALADISSMLDPAPAKQNMEVASSTGDSSSDKKTEAVKSDNSTAYDTDKPTKADEAAVKDIIAKSKQVQSEKAQVPTSQSSTMTASPLDHSSLGVKQNSAQLKELDSQLNSINQQMLMLQQQSDQKIEAMGEQITLLSQQTDKLTQALRLLNSEMSQLKKAYGASNVTTDPAAVAGTASSMMLWLIVTLVLSLALSIFALIYARRGVATSAAVGGLSPEYDFMGSEEGVQAKLDLARSYLAMGDHTKMRDVLSQVFSHGTPEEKKQAQALLNKIK